MGSKLPGGTAVPGIPGSSLVAVKGWRWWRLGPRGTRCPVPLSSGPRWRIEMRWGIVQWRLHVYGWVIYELDGFGSEENQQQTKCGLLPTWVTGLFSVVLVRLYSRDGWVDGSEESEIIRVEEWTASCFPKVLD